jgi:hypothetical protein
MLKSEYLNPETLIWAHAQPLSRKPLLLKGNSKTGTLGKFGYLYRTKGLAVHDCPNATDTCKNACYAMMDHLFNLKRGQGVAHEYSQLAHHNPELLFDTLDQEISHLLTIPRIRTKGLVVRIHESGDFVSAMHARVYVWLAAKYPQVTFFGYSRSFQTPEIARALVELNTYPNAYVRESLDNERPIGTGLAATSFFGDKVNEPVKSFKCIEQITKNTDNHIKCIDCGLCWTQSKLNVIFKEH